MLNTTAPRKVLLAEFNEITWRVIDRLTARGRLPVFQEFQRQGAWGSPIADEVPPNLDPWISWTTVYTGRPQSEHGVKFLEQPHETVTGPRVADLAADAGKVMGIYGSIMHWPPRRDIRGFWVPSTFSPSAETTPDALRPIQEFNLKHTRAHNPLAEQPRDNVAKQGLQLARLGLKPTTVAEVAAALARWKAQPHRKWEKVSLQPLVNIDFFEKLYRRHQPDFATFHTNHVAHYMHRFWRAFDPAPFLSPPSPEEVRKFGPAIEFGYKMAERVLKRLWKLVDADTVLVLASGLGQQPYVVEDFPEGRKVVRIKDIKALLELCGVTGHCEAIPMMAPQWNVRVPDPQKRTHAETVLREAMTGDPPVRLYAFDTVGDTLCVNVFQNNLKTIDLEAPCTVAGKSFKLGDLIATQDATPKEGYHDRAGLVIFRGAGVRKGAQIGACSNLDLAPTMLHLMGLPIPSHMKGRVLEEAFVDGPTRVAMPAAAAAATS